MPASSHLKGTVALIEELGADLLAHVRVDAAPVQIVDTVAGEAAREELAPSAIDRDTAVIVARLAADAEISKGRTVDLEVDVGRIHLFDLGTTESLTAGKP